MPSQFTAYKTAWGSSSLYRIPRALGNEPECLETTFSSSLNGQSHINLLLLHSLAPADSLRHWCIQSPGGVGANSYKQALYIQWNQRFHGLIDHRDSHYYRSVLALVTGTNNGAVPVPPLKRELLPCFLNQQKKAAEGVIFLLTVLVPFFNIHMCT